MRTILLLFLCSLALSHAHAQDLDAHLRAAAELNPAVQARYAEFEAALKRSAQVRGLPDPTLTVGFSLTPPEKRMDAERARFSLMQMFPWFGTLGSQAEVVDRQAEARYEAYLSARNELFYKVRMAYYPLHELGRAIAIAHDDLEILRSYKTFALARFKGGTGSMVDVLRIDLLINAEVNDIAILEERRKPLHATFAATVGYADPILVDVSDSLQLVDLADYTTDSLEHNPLLSELDRQASVEMAQAEAARKLGLPRFGLGVEYMVMDKNSPMMMPGMSSSEVQQTANELASAYEVAYFEAHKAALDVGLMDQQIGIAEQALNLLLDAYSNSGDDLEEVLRMQEQVLRFQLLRLSAMREHHSAIAQLEYLTAKQIVRP